MATDSLFRGSVYFLSKNYPAMKKDKTEVLSLI